MKNLIQSAFLFLFVFLGACQQNTKKYSVVNATEFKNLIETTDVQLIDVRTPAEFNQGHIEGAVNIDFMNKNFEQEIQKLDKSKPTLIYCKVGGRSQKAGSRMFELDFISIYELSGGFDNWK
uniref:rhodanese-like domain-containing protein n=1 Tax=Flavobacterium sp. TaxID=239 RepID=UPI0040492D93